MKLKVGDPVVFVNRPSLIGHIQEINGPNKDRKLKAWIGVWWQDQALSYHREEELTLVNQNKSSSIMTTSSFFDKWRRIINISTFEIRAGVKQNAISHSINKEKRKIDPFEEGKILEVLKQLKRDIEKLKLP